MFTGIIEEVGKVKDVRPTETGYAMTVHARRIPDTLDTGESIAVNGVCVTVVRSSPSAPGDGGGTFTVDVLRKTWDITNLSRIRRGTPVNLERALAIGKRLGGHFVTGHVDCVGMVRSFELRGGDRVLFIEAPRNLSQWLIERGSVAVDGVSLTIAEARDGLFAVHLVPHTLAATTLRNTRRYTGVNIEVDILARYARPLEGNTVTETFLRDHGFF
jgi:riboflavin synthase